jgi:LPXTG-motif cell wall-anchored protein
MSADQELAATGTSGIIPALLAGVAFIVLGVAALWRRAARAGADS